MLQQTQVERVKDYYKNWLKQFPNWKRLAEASNEEVIRAWAGLGYNRRALVLRDIAKQVVHQGVPDSPEGWRDLKGIGPYTSSAISAFAQKKRTLPVDTNIRRVLGRYLFGITFPDLKDDEKILKQAETFLPKRGAFYDVPQAIFDLATMICTKNPNCARCPLRKDCKAAQKFLSGRVQIPKRSVVKSKEKKHRNKRHPDRIYRGRILKLVREQHRVAINKIGAQIDPHYEAKLDQAWVRSMCERLAKDGLVKKQKNTLTL